jgi:hypothetical protein
VLILPASRPDRGAEIHLHENHKTDARACGHIIAWRDAPEKGKVIYRFRADDTLSRKPPPDWPGQGPLYIPRPAFVHQNYASKKPFRIKGLSLTHIS